MVVRVGLQGREHKEDPGKNGLCKINWPTRSGEIPHKYLMSRGNEVVWGYKKVHLPYDDRLCARPRLADDEDDDDDDQCTLINLVCSPL